MADQDVATGPFASDTYGLQMPPHTYIVCGAPEPSDLRLLQDIGTELHFLPTASHVLQIKQVPGCLLLELDHRQQCVVEVERMVATGCLDLPLIVSTRKATVAEAVKWMKAGAADFIEKPYSKSCLMNALTLAWSESKYARTVADTPLARLTVRQRAVLHFIANGLHNQEIANAMDLSVRTVEMHRARLIKALGVRTSAEAVMRLYILKGEASPSHAKFRATLRGNGTKLASSPLNGE